MHEANDSCMESYPETFRCKEEFCGQCLKNAGHSIYTSQPRTSDTDDSRISSQPSVTSDANASFTRPIAEESVHLNTTLPNQHSIIGSNISFGINSPNAPTHANAVNASQVLVETKTKKTFTIDP